MSWSSGKDSAWALREVLQSDEYEVVGLLTTINQEFDRVAMHAVRSELLRAQARVLGLPLIEVSLPWPCSNLEYERIMNSQVELMRDDGITAMIFGDLYLEDIRRYREDKLKDSGIVAVFPLWGRPTRQLAHEMIDSGLVAHLTAVDPRQIDSGFVGRRFDHSLLKELPAQVDPCGENGEFHTFVSWSPSYDEALSVHTGEVVERDGFWFCDLTLSS